MNEYLGKTIVGLTEKVILKGEHETKELVARIDTGATKSSIDLALADKLGLGPVVDSRLIKSAHGVKLRPVVQAQIVLGGKTILAKFTLADRNHMKYSVLVGQNVLKKNFLVDPNLNYDSLQRYIPIEVKKDSDKTIQTKIEGEPIAKP